MLAHLKNLTDLDCSENPLPFIHERPVLIQHLFFFESFQPEKPVSKEEYDKIYNLWETTGNICMSLKEIEEFQGIFF